MAAKAEYMKAQYHLGHFDVDVDGLDVHKMKRLSVHGLKNQ
jgi:hypothetical protein|tara:strand:+ start:217 stop:339 length:123 start_codon:yes stop_codon:yes gene_type:complete